MKLTNITKILVMLGAGVDKQLIINQLLAYRSLAASCRSSDKLPDYSGVHKASGILPLRVDILHETMCSVGIRQRVCRVGGSYK